MADNRFLTRDQRGLATKAEGDGLAVAGSDTLSAGSAVREREVLAFQERLDRRARAFDDADLTIIAEFSIYSYTPRRNFLQQPAYGTDRTD